MKRSKPLARKTPLRSKRSFEPKERRFRPFKSGPRLPKRSVRKRRPAATPAEKAHMSAVAKLGCIVSRNIGRGKRKASLHHIRTGYGAGQRASHWEVIPLTPDFHQNGGFGVAFHAGERTWMAKYGTEIALLKQVYDELGIPFEKLPELRGSEPPWWKAFLDGRALDNKASELFHKEDFCEQDHEEVEG